MYIYCSLATFSVLVNRSSVGYFGCSTGLRGDPILLLLFLLVAEMLGRMLDIAADRAMLEGFHVGVMKACVFRIFKFADDTLILCNNSLIFFG